VRPFALRPVAIVVALKMALGFAFAGRYGWHRDALYYAVAGRHLQGGYVEFPPVTALVSALARELFGWSLFGFNAMTVLAGAATTLVGALVARELGGGRRAQTLAAIGVAFCPGMLATNDLFQPVSFDQLTTMVVLWLALRLALGRGSWALLGVAAGVGLETKYTLAVVLALLVATFLVWRRELLRGWGLPLAVGIAALLALPNVVWEARHDWISVRWFLNPPPSGSDETRPAFVLNVLLLANPLLVPAVVAGVRALVRDRRARPLGWTAAGTVAAYLLLGGKSYYALPAITFALAAGAVPFDGWLTRRRGWAVGVAYVGSTLAVLPILLPVLPVATADRLGILDARGDYPSELGWPTLVRTVQAHAAGVDVIVTQNYGEAGALEVLGHGLPPVATGHVTFRYWRPRVAGRRALLVNLGRARAASFCTGYRVVARIAQPEERGGPIARCTLDGSLAAVWPRIVAVTFR
jgi:Dolichyl-phosphate-mannose-protein mannosyltransferase